MEVFILSTIAKKNFAIRSDGKSTRDYVYVEDVVDAYIKLFNKLKTSKNNLKIYNVSSKFNYSVKKIVKMILKIMNKENLEPTVLNNSKQELNFQRLNYSKIQRELKWKPKTNINKGLIQTIDWYIKNYRFFRKK